MYRYMYMYTSLHIDTRLFLRYIYIDMQPLLRPTCKREVSLEGILVSPYPETRCELVVVQTHVKCKTKDVVVDAQMSVL